MTNQKMVNYFKKWEGAASVGIGLLAAGILCLWIGFAYTMFLALLGMLLLLIGAFLTIYGNIGRASLSDLSDRIQREKDAVAFPELKENPAFRRRLLHPEQVSMHTVAPKEDDVATEYCGYEFHDGLLFKRMKDGSHISSEYTCAKLEFLSDAFYIKSRTFSFLSDQATEKTYDLRFSEVRDIVVNRKTVSVSSPRDAFRVQICRICFLLKDGTHVALHCKDDIYAEELAQKLKAKMIQK